MIRKMRADLGMPLYSLKPSVWDGVRSSFLKYCLVIFTHCSGESVLTWRRKQNGNHAVLGALIDYLHLHCIHASAVHFEFGECCVDHAKVRR